MRVRVLTPSEYDASAARLMLCMTLPDLDLHSYVAGALHPCAIPIPASADLRTHYRERQFERLSRSMHSMRLDECPSAPYFLGVDTAYLRSFFVSARVTF